MSRKLLLVVSTLFVLSACRPPPTATPTPTVRPLTTASPTLDATEPPLATPTPTVDPLVLIQAATLFETDFEAGVPPAIQDWNRRWEARQATDANAVYCNALADDWVSFTFGAEDLTDYAVQADVQLLSEGSQFGYELYVRFGAAGEGYRASVYNGYASLSFYPPPADFGGRDVSIQPGEWHTLRAEAVGQTLRYFVDDELIASADDDRGASGQAGIGASPGTEICVDNLRLWQIDEHGPVAVAPIEDYPLAKYEGVCRFCFVDGSEPDMPIWDSGRQGYLPQPDDPREQIVIDETFSVPAGEEVVFEDQIIWIRPQRRGNIEVRGTLIVRNSLLLWDQTEHQQTRLTVIEKGVLQIENTYAFGTNPYWINWDYEDEATIRLDHFVGDPWTSIKGAVDYTAVNYSSVGLTLLTQTNGASVQISDAHWLHLELIPSAGVHEITFPEKDAWVDWDLSGLWPDTIITATHSHLYAYDVSLYDDVHLTVRDAPEGFSLGWAVSRDSPGFVDCELRGLGDPDSDEGVFYDYQVWDLPCNNSSFTVINSLLLRSWPVAWGNVHLKIYDSNMVDPRVFSGPATMEIYNSTVEHIAAYLGGKIYLENVRIRNDIEVKDPGSIIYGYGVTPRDAGREIEIIEVDGGQYIELDSPGPPW